MMIHNMASEKNLFYRDFCPMRLLRVYLSDKSYFFFLFLRKKFAKEKYRCRLVYTYDVQLCAEKLGYVKFFRSIFLGSSIFKRFVGFPPFPATTP